MSGNVGSPQRLEYTALGDTTNTAARLEGMTKGTDHQIYLAESTRDGSSDVRGVGHAGYGEVQYNCIARKWKHCRDGFYFPGGLQRGGLRDANIGDEDRAFRRGELACVDEHGSAESMVARSGDI